jgi:glycosyltransferase involved in cell wall biosynthesis
MKVLLLSAYAARSHVHWQRSLQAMFPHWQWCVLSLPPRHFSWRVRGNALYWSMVERETLEDDYGLLITTSMVDLATLRGLVPALTRIPTVVYFHENQFAYPQDKQQHSLLDAQVASIYSALAGDRLLFNSCYNLDSFLSGCAALLDKLPDRVPPGVVSRLRSRATVLPVPIDDRDQLSGASWWPGTVRRSRCQPLRLLWMGRFEHDKGPEGLLRVLRQLEGGELDFELAVTGQQFRRLPAALCEIEAAFGHRLVQFGYVESVADYRALLGAADIVLSTARHEFQGLAVMEAVACRCLPVVPDRLVYREIYSPQFRYESCPDDPEREAAAAAALINTLARDLRKGDVQPPDVSAFSLQQLRPRYAQCLHEAVVAQDSQ